MRTTQTLMPTLGALFSFIASPALSLELHPVEAPQAGLDARAADYSALNLQTVETFLWGGADNSNAALANLTVYTSGKTEHIINLERFKNLVTSVKCAKESTTLTFDSDEAFAHLMDAWNWTNEHDDNTFIMVSGSGHCDSTGKRQPYVISSVEYNNATNTATLNGKQSDWKSVAHTYDLHIGGMPSSKLMQRDYSDTFSLNFTHDINFGKWAIDVAEGVQVTAICTGCHTTGEFDFNFDIKTVLGIPKGATLTLNPKGVSAVIDPTIGLAGDLSGSKNFKKTFLTIPIEGVSIAEIVELGPAIAFSGSLDIGPLKGIATVTSGLTLSLNDDADFTIDLLSPSDASANNWSPEVKGDDTSVSAMITGGASLGVLADIEFDITVLGKGLSAGIGLNPLAGVALSAIDSSAGACKDDPEKHQYGVQLGPYAGVYLQASVSDVATVTITSETISLPTYCYGFGSPLTTGAATSSAVPTTTAVPTSTAVPTASSTPVIPSSSAAIKHRAAAKPTSF